MLTADGTVLNPGVAAWEEVDKGGRTIEDLRQELAGTERVSVEVQCEGIEEVPEDCRDRWFAGFDFPLVQKPLSEPEIAGDNEDELEEGLALASAAGSSNGGSESSSSSSA